jgi:hypothetical protein
MKIGSVLRPSGWRGKRKKKISQRNDKDGLKAKAK